MRCMRRGATRGVACGARWPPGLKRWRIRTPLAGLPSHPPLHSVADCLRRGGVQRPPARCGALGTFARCGQGRGAQHGELWPDLGLCHFDAGRQPLCIRHAEGLSSVPRVSHMSVALSLRVAMHVSVMLCGHETSTLGHVPRRCDLLSSQRHSNALPDFRSVNPDTRLARFDQHLNYHACVLWLCSCFPWCPPVHRSTHVVGAAEVLDIDWVTAPVAVDLVHSFWRDSVAVFAEVRIKRCGDDSVKCVAAFGAHRNIVEGFDGSHVRPEALRQVSDRPHCWWRCSARWRRAWH